MPIYEFYCRPCHRVFSFLSRAVDTARTPSCPRCGAPELVRRVSPFAISKWRKEEPKPAAREPDLDEGRLERAMEALAGEMDGIDENDPRQGARLMRKLFSATGMPVGAGMEEALRRMESGEDPEKIEDGMGDVLGGDPRRCGRASCAAVPASDLAEAVREPPLSPERPYAWACSPQQRSSSWTVTWLIGKPWVTHRPISSSTSPCPPPSP